MGCGASAAQAESVNGVKPRIATVESKVESLPRVMGASIVSAVCKQKEVVEPIRFCVAGLDGNAKEIDVPSDELVSDVKVRAANALGVAAKTPVELLCEGRVLEGTVHACTIQSSHLQLIVAALQTCTFVSCADDGFDTNGILYALGTDFGRRTYTNPADSGVVRLLWSPDANNYYSTVGGHKQGDSQQAARIICANKHCGANATQWSRGGTGAWFAIDLVSKEVCLTHFAYRNDYGGGNNHPRTYELQGSNDGISWTTLSAHKDESWSGKGAKHWPVRSKDQYFFLYGRVDSVVLGGHQKDQYFRMLRILNKAAPNHLCCSGIEFYGSVRDC